MINQSAGSNLKITSVEDVDCLRTYTVTVNSDNIDVDLLMDTVNDPRILELMRSKRLYGEFRCEPFANMIERMQITPANIAYWIKNIYTVRNETDTRTIVKMNIVIDLMIHPMGTILVKGGYLDYDAIEFIPRIFANRQRNQKAFMVTVDCRMKPEVSYSGI